MKPNAKLRVVQSHGAEVSREFGISLTDSAHIMNILRSMLYTDKELAVLREYSTNAWDAHQDSGKESVPIQVTLPTQMEPTLSVRDFGPGLSQEDVFNVYTQYGASTKRRSNKTVGTLGIGCKAGFAYSDSFTITSYHGGTKSTYVAVLDASEKGEIKLLHEEPCGEETGVLIQVAVRPEDISDFYKKAQRLFRYWKPKPIINTEIPELPAAQLDAEHGVIYGKAEDTLEAEWTAVMGCVPYRIDLKQLTDFEEGIAGFLSDLYGALYFEIGEVEMSASREELKYSENTKRVLVEKFNLLVDEYVGKTLAAIDKADFTPWERRVRARVLEEMRLPVPLEWKELVKERISLDDKDVLPKDMHIWRPAKGREEVAHYLPVSEDTRLILRDTRRSLKGYTLKEKDFLVRVDGKSDWDEIEEDVEWVMRHLGLGGIPIVRLSTLDWTPATDANGRTVNHKHRKRFFKLLGTRHTGRNSSRNWEVVERVPEKGDVFVLLSQFRATNSYFFEHLEEDHRLAQHFKKELPVIYGYKTTDKRPVKPADCTGQHYPEWRSEFLVSLITPRAKELMALKDWTSVVYHSWYYDGPKAIYKTYQLLSKGLGRRHPIVKFYRRSMQAKTFFNKKDKCGLKEALDILWKARREDFGPSLAQQELKELLKKYPLLNLERIGIQVLWDKDNEHWLEYVRLVDRDTKGSTP